MTINAPEAMVRRSRETDDMELRADKQDSSVLSSDAAVKTDYLPTHAELLYTKDDHGCGISLEATPGASTQREDNDATLVARTGPTVGEIPLQLVSAPAQAGTSGADQAAGSSEPDSRPPTRSANPADFKFAQSLDASAFENGDFDTFIAIPYEPTTKPEGRDEPPPCKSSSATRPFILRRSKEAQKRAALSQSPATNSFADRYDYLKKYPADPPEEAMGPDARVWRVYLDEAEQFDIDMVDGFKDTVDVMLVFAGLFSAVVTTFVVQSSTALQLDYNQVIASILIEQLHIQRATASGLPTPVPLPTTLSLDSTTTTALDRWANGLWFVSLSFSLATALFTVLVKQWIQSYVSPVSGPPQTRVRVRQYRFMGLEKWQVPLIVGLLPTLLHLSLLLFFMGLVVFLFALDRAITGVILSITTVVYFIYVVTNLAPLFNTQCPYKTPLSAYALLLLHSYIPGARALSRSIIRRVRAVSVLVRVVIRHTSQVLRTLAAHLRPLMRKFCRFWSTTISHIRMMYGSSSRPLRRSLRRPSSESLETTNDYDGPPPQDRRTLGSMKACELEDITAQGDATDAKALCWLVTWSSSPSIKTIVVEAAGDLRIGFAAKAKCILRDDGVADAACASLRMSRKPMGVRSGYEFPHLRATLAHFQLGMDIVTESAHTFSDKRITSNCRCMSSPWYFPVRNVDGRLGPYVSLLDLPKWELVRPQQIQHFLASNSHKIVFLLSLRRAALYLRTTSSSVHRLDDMADWSSCQRLFALVRLEPPRNDLFGLWQTTLVSVYLESLVPKVAPISNASGLLRKLLFNQIELGSPELSQDLAVDLSLQSCMGFFVYVLRNPTRTAPTDFLSSPASSQFIEHLCYRLDIHQHWVLDPEKEVIDPYNTLLIILLDHSEKHGCLTVIGLRRLIYILGYNLMTRHEPQSSDPEQDLAPVLRRLLRASLISPQLSEPYQFRQSQINCLCFVLCGSPPKNRPSLTAIFRMYDGITTLERMSVSTDLELTMKSGSSDKDMIEFSLVFYLNEVYSYLIGESNPPYPEIEVAQQRGQTDSSSSQEHLRYILQHLAQVIRTCVARYHRKISHSEADSYPDTLHILRLLLETQREVSPEWDHALAELESQGFALPVSRETPKDAEHNVQEIISILRSDLQVPRSPIGRTSPHPELYLPPRRSTPEVCETDLGPSLEFLVAQANEQPPVCTESFLSRLMRRFKTGARESTTPLREISIPIISPRVSPPLEQVRESEIDDAGERESIRPRRDEEEGFPATDTYTAAR